MKCISDRGIDCGQSFKDIFNAMLLYGSLIFSLMVLGKVADAIDDVLVCLIQASEEDLENMSLILYEGSYDQYTEVPIGNASVLMSKIDTSKKTVAYVHGWLNIQDPRSTEAIIRAYLSTKLYNVIRLNWDTISNNLYDYSACSTPGVGRHLGNALSSLVASGLDETTLSLVGHSLGAQIIGFAARAANFILALLIGLDPANPGFNTLMPHLATGDGRFVIIIHTDRGFFGINLQTGDVDFYPNDGISPQPGCLTLNYCSHYRSCFYWAEAVQIHTAFFGLRCDSWSNFVAGSCSSNEVIEMSPDTPTTANGAYYFQTNGASPYGRGIDGTVYA